MASASNVFIFGLDDFHRAQLATIEQAQRFNFEPLLAHDEAIHPEVFPVDEMLAKSQRTLEQYPDSVDAVCTYWDFPTSTLVPILRERFGLAGADLSAVLKLEHKYWARREQQAVVPELIPDFCAVDPFADDPAESLSIDYPLWLKPIKAHSSYLGFRIHNDREWRQAIEQTRRGIEQFAKPFNEILAFADLPAAIAPIGGYHCIAEGIISAGQQCTLEGYAYQSEVVVYGVVDSVRGGRHRSSFQRYQYPSALPRRVQSRMIDAARRVIRHAGYTDAPFNMEFFWHRSRDTLSLLEVNARCSKSHSPLFHLVDGASHLQVMVNLGVGREPNMPARRGEFALAAKFMLREFKPGVVRRVPSADDINRLYARFPDAQLHVHVEAGQDLNALRFQDSYSFGLADLFLGANDQRQLLEKYAEAQAILGFEVAYQAPAA